MQYQVTHRTVYTYPEPTPVCHNEVHLTPRATARQTCLDHQLLIVPEPAYLGSRTDYFGNLVGHFSIHDSHQGLSVTASSRIQLSAPPPIDLAATPPWEEVRERLPGDRSPSGLEAFQFVFESPLVSQLADLAAYARPLFPPQLPIGAAAAGLTAAIHRDFRYHARATSVDTPLVDVVRHRHGVCQDFAHVALGCLRSLGLAARYVSGYLRTLPPPGKPRLVGADASHAWFSVYCGQAGWIDFDPTNDLPVALDHITLAWGRDYSDVAPIRGVFLGSGQHTLRVSVDVEPCT